MWFLISVRARRVGLDGFHTNIGKRDQDDIRQKVAFGHSENNYRTVSAKLVSVNCVKCVLPQSNGRYCGIGLFRYQRGWVAIIHTFQRRSGQLSAENVFFSVENEKS